MNQSFTVIMYIKVCILRNHNNKLPTYLISLSLIILLRKVAFVQSLVTRERLDRLSWFLFVALVSVLNRRITVKNIHVPEFCTCQTVKVLFLPVLILS